MKKIFLLVTLVTCSVVLFGQVKTPPKPAAKTPAKPVTKTPVKTTPPLLKNAADSAGYAIGVTIGTSMKTQYMTKVNTTVLLKALNDVLQGKPVVMDETNAITILNAYAGKMQDENNPLVLPGKVFLDSTRLRPGVKVTPSGLQYEVITEGTGVKPRAIDTFVCNYRGTLIDGTEFDASYKHNGPLVMAVNQVIPGWREGLQLMGIGSKYKFYIPYNLGYGLRGYPPDIPGGAALIFEVELLDVKKAAGY
jgi:FKBP-type peptidyl-prolyl cis-trans isomerase FkpA